jgi:biopolymer transport protein ExbB/TolQ
MNVMDYLKHVIEANGILFSLAFLAMRMAAVFLVALRFIKNLKAHTDIEQFVARLEELLQTQGPAAVVETCRREAHETDQIMPKLFRAAFEEGHRGKIAARDAMADCMDLEIMPRLHSALPGILFLIKTAPMMGLLGTVVGMIGAFETIAGATKVDPSALANDIGMALFTTAEGLFIAVPLILFYTLFRERVNRFEVELQRGSQEALKLLPRIYAPRA